MEAEGMTTGTRARRARPRGRGKGEMAAFVKEAERLGAIRAAAIDPRTVVTGTWVRLKCQFGCGGYGSSLCCPPHSPRPEETRRVLDEYRQAILFEGPMGECKRIAVELERHVFLHNHPKALGLGAGGCYLCRKACAFDEGCRHPEKARPSMEGCGIDVFSTVRAHGFAMQVLRSTEEEGHHFGLVLVE